MKRFLPIIFAVLGFTTLLLIWNYAQPQSTPVEPQPVQQTEVTGTPVTETVELRVALPGGETLVFERAYLDNLTALALLQEAAAANSVTVRVEEYDFGSFVSAIGDATSSAQQAWVYYINNESAQVGADQYLLQPADLIEWKYEAVE